MYDDNKTICAVATSSGSGAIAVIRLSGENTFDILEAVFQPIGKLKLSDTKSHTLRFGTINSKDGKLIDEVLVSIFRAPHSYTGENSVEISCHASDYIVNEIMRLLLAAGASLAGPGEFTKRAYINGKMDLAQAEAVADLIASETEAAHKVAMQQMKGGFSKELSSMRDSLLQLVSLMELELDFSEEEVEFADRTQLNNILAKVSSHISSLIESFRLGNVIKNGVPVAIVGATNTGKSTLLNKLLGEERAIVSNIHGTTRDTIEDTVNIDGVTFRFIDTAGIRTTTEKIEIIGIERTYWKMKQASIVIPVLDAERASYIYESLDNLSQHISDQDIIILLNKVDLVSEIEKVGMIADIEAACTKSGLKPLAIIPISAKNDLGVDVLRATLSDSRISLKNTGNGVLVTNIRHYEALTEALTSLNRVKDGLDTSLPTDLVAQDIREALYYIGSITGEITPDEILGNIFGNFCIGK